MKTISYQFIKFSFVGGLNTFIHYILFVALFRIVGLDITVATIIGYMAGMLNSFVLNRVWTFKVEGSGYTGELMKFILVNGIALLVNVIILKLLTEQLSVLPEVAQVGAILFSLVVNFSGNKWWTFRRNRG